MKKSRQLGVDLPTDYETILQSYQDFAKGYGAGLEFRRGRALTPDSLGANAGFFKRSKIVATPEWALRLIFDNEYADRAFKITLGHELTHKEDPFLPYFLNVKFCAWVNELHADFGSVKKMFDGERCALLYAIDYKMTYRKNKGKKDVDRYSHPSWARRKNYIQNYNFDDELIHKIAHDVKCKNQKLIDYVCGCYERIVLR